MSPSSIMSGDAESVRARRYLLGEASEDECAEIEQHFLAHEDAVDRIAAVEDDLIEDYLTNRMGQADRDRFERVYLSVPHRRIRVETMRRLAAHGTRSSPVLVAKSRSIPVQVARPGPWLALAASLLLLASLALWTFMPGNARDGELVDRGVPSPTVPVVPDQTGTPSAAGPRLFAVTISPNAVRSASENPPLVLPTDTQRVVVHLEGDGGQRTLVASRATIRTVSGTEVWRGAVTMESQPPPGTVARLEVDAASLPADDYLITLYGSDQTGTEQEWNQYFLRLRAQ